MSSIYQIPDSTSSAPSGPAGGDLSGTFPNPSVVKINGVALSGLATGILKNTTGTGVPSIAVAADVVSLFTTCSGTQYLGADGACHTASSGSVTSISFTGGLISVANPTTTPALTVAGTSGGIPYFSSTSTWASSALLTQNSGIFGGGAGATPFTDTVGPFVDPTNHTIGINVTRSGAVSTTNPILLIKGNGTTTGLAFASQNSSAANTFTLSDAGTATASADMVALGTLYVERANGLIFISGSTATQRARIQSDSNNALNFKVGTGSVSSMYMANTGAVSMGNGNTGNLTGTFSSLDTTATTGVTLSCFGYDCSGTFTGTHTSATTSRVMVVAGQAQSTTHLQDWTNNTGTAQSFVDSNFSLNANGYMSRGTKFTISGCSAGTTVGGATAGQFASGTTGACTVVITMNGATGLTAPSGWSCAAANLTTPANLFQQSATSTTTCTVTGTTVSGDTITFHAMAY